jgi:hypothetical protein
MWQDGKRIGHPTGAVAIKNSPILKNTRRNRIAQWQVRANKRQNGFPQRDDAKIGAARPARATLLSVDITHLIVTQLPLGD